jgi:hypothetical protein
MRLFSIEEECSLKHHLSWESWLETLITYFNDGPIKEAHC